MRKLPIVTPLFVIVHVAALHALVLWFGDGDVKAERPYAGDPPGAPHAGDLGASARATAGEAPPIAAAASGDEAPALADAEDALAAELADPLGPQLQEVTAADRAAAALHPGALKPRNFYEDDGRFHASLDHGWLADLTLDSALHNAASRALDRARVPVGAVVVVDVRTGEVLALADRLDVTHAAAPELPVEGAGNLGLRAFAPAASIFKIVTAAALIESGVSPTRAFAHVNAPRRVTADALKPPSTGGPRASLIEAFAKSNNGYFARQADQHLERDTLDGAARRAGFNAVVPFDLSIEASTARVPRNRLERARMAAGFWNTRLTPLHGALLAAAAAGDGSMLVPVLVKRLRSPDGRVVEAPRRPPFSIAMKAETARHLRVMMAETVSRGTARKAFSKWPSSLGKPSVGGKTGTLSSRDRKTHYTWFVGYAPLDNPQVAIAVVVGNGELWWQRAPDVAREVLASWTRLNRERAVAVAEAAPAAP